MAKAALESRVKRTAGSAIKRFDREAPRGGGSFTYIGSGEFGGKAEGLATIQKTITDSIGSGKIGETTVAIPSLVVITTEFFDAFMERNRLWETVALDLPDDRVAHAFQKADLPAELVGDLRALAHGVRVPLALRSSSLLEDAVQCPFAGVYMTKMTPNNQLDADERFRKLAEGIKLVWASTFLAQARAYRRSVGRNDRDEKMAVIAQEVAGRRYGSRFYPNVSGVARSYNYYPAGHARPEDGVALLALGLGKTVVDGEPSWTYSPAYPKAPPPFNSIGDLLKHTQAEFWAVNMGRVPYDPIKETEHLVRVGVSEAEEDDTLRFVASTYDTNSNRITAGTTVRGPRVINFAPLLQYGQVPLNDLILALLSACEGALGGPVEIEFAVVFDPRNGVPADCGFLQVRPLIVGNERVNVDESEMERADTFVACRRALGNGTVDDLQDVVYVKPGEYNRLSTAAIAAEVASFNDRLVAAGCAYLLLGPGRWGTTDPSGGVPVKWGQVSGARVMVEASSPEHPGELSQGSHFFHNLTNLRVLYFSVSEGEGEKIDWEWLGRQAAVDETRFLRHVRLGAPLLIKVDGGSGRGVIAHHD